MSPVPQEPARLADWEAFYRDYRKPGYVAGFEITTKLGGGAFGLVYRAKRLSIGKDYAIKFLQVDDLEVRKAILAELEQVKLFAQIDHPNLVSIEDRGEVDGIPYLVMAFAGTETLRDRMPQGRPPNGEEKDELLRCFLQCCRALLALHERSLVHFDIKPANVFLKGSVARLGDYGLSKLVTHSRGSLSMGRGTPYYMAPELLQRRGDHRSDIYSLGVLLYELLCGVVPFKGDSEWEVLKAHETKAPELPPHLTARERSVLLRCLAKDPAARYQSVQDVIAAFGVPSSAGAAAWSEVSTGTASAHSATLASLPMPEPPPLPGSPEDPYVALGRASQDAARHAKVIAGRAAKRAHRHAAQAMRGAARKFNDYRRQRGSGWWWGNGRTKPAAPPAAEPQEPARRGWSWPFLFVAVMLFVGVLVLWTSAGVAVPRPSQNGRASRSAVAAPQPPAAPSFAKSLFRDFKLAPGFERAVATAEPAWAALAAVDREAAKVQLLARIEELRGIAPLTSEARRLAPSLPHFGRLAVDEQMAERVRTELRELAAGADAEGLARELAVAQPWSLAIAAQMLNETEWRQGDDLGRAHRLHDWLQRATGCMDIELVADADLSLLELRQANQQVGELWLWFVNEFAHTPRTWQVYRELLRD